MQLFAVPPSGPRALSTAVSGGTVHDLLERLPGGVYSALRTFRHECFLWLEEHLARTERSMRGLGWNKELDRERLLSALDATVRDYPLDDARVRFDVLEHEHELDGVRADLFIALSPFVAVPEAFLREGVALDFAPHLRRDSPRIKTTAFVLARKPFPIGSQQRYEHLLLDEQQRVLECSSSNVAFVRGSELITAGDGVLEGITLAVLLHLAPKLGLTVVHRRLPLAELETLDEAFLSSSARGPVPVVRIGERVIGTGRVGPRVRALTEAYYALAASDARPARRR
ncbi:MAG: aminotransferase class IV family protein [Planctomycetes bacterium]|nr:aminotransferase class IV family protein [Planctomycetota bacterium]